MAVPWREALRDAVAKVDNFPAHCKKLGTGKGWAHADSAELVGLETWGTALANKHLAAGVGALVAAARAGFADVVTAGGAAFDGMALTGTEADPIVDGAAQEVQIARAARWLDDPKTAASVKEALDPTRQLYVWDDDLRPKDKDAFYWYLDVGQLCSAAIVNATGKKLSANGEGYYEWPSEVCVGRGLVVAARGLRMPKVKTAAILTRFHTAFVAAAATKKSS